MTRVTHRRPSKARKIDGEIRTKGHHRPETVAMATERKRAWATPATTYDAIRAWWKSRGW